MHAQAAWVSTGGETEEKLARMPVLLKRLASEKHGTPFEHSQLTFLVTSEIASHIQAIRHRVGISFNVESARYRELLDDKIYVPTDWPEHIQERYYKLASEMMNEYHYLIAELEEAGIHRTRAKESARFIRPYGAMISYYVTFNFRSFAYFQSLRNEIHAQREIAVIADAMLILVKAIPDNPFKHSLAAFNL